MVSTEKLIGTTEHVTLCTRCRLNRCRYNRVRLYLLVGGHRLPVEYIRFTYGWSCRINCTIRRKHKKDTNTFFFVAQQPNSGLRCRIIELSRSHTIIHKHRVWVLWANDQLVAEAATYTTQKKEKRRTPMPSVGFEPAIPATKWLQTYYALNSTITGIGKDNTWI